MSKALHTLPPVRIDPRVKSLPYPVAALGNLMGPAVERMAEIIGTPSAMAAQSVLATAALASQAHANVQLDGRNCPLPLYLLTVACSGDRKSAVDQVALQAARDWEREQWLIYGEKLKAHRATARTASKAKASKKSPELDLDTQPEPAEPRLLTTEPTIEGLIKNLCQGLPSMGLFSDEGGMFLGGSTMNRDNMLKAITQLSTLWDGSPIDRSRAMAGESSRAYERRLSLHLMLQPLMASRLLQDQAAKDQGILGRCMISWPERLVGKRMYKAVDLTRDPKVMKYHHRITSLLQQPWRRHKDGGLKPIALELTPRTRNVWIDIHDTIEGQSSDIGELANVQASASKAAANVLRIAGVLATMEQSTALDEDHILRASTLMDYYLTEIQRLTEREGLNKMLEDADRLL